MSAWTNKLVLYYLCSPLEQSLSLSVGCICFLCSPCALHAIHTFYHSHYCLMLHIGHRNIKTHVRWEPICLVIQRLVLSRDCGFLCVSRACWSQRCAEYSSFHDRDLHFYCNWLKVHLRCFIRFFCWSVNILCSLSVLFTCHILLFASKISPLFVLPFLPRLFCCQRIKTI